MTVVLSIIAIGLSCYVWFSQPSKKQLKALKSAEKENKELKTTLANILDENGEVIGKLRLPGITKDEEEKFAPRDFKPRGIIEWWRSRNPDYLLDRTPCGLCSYAFWSERYRENNKGWRCEADQGRSVDLSREYFLNRKNQCSMFSRKSRY